MIKLLSRTGNSRNDNTKAHIIVLLFVVAHAIVCLLFHDTKLGDGMPLTILTIAMVYFLILFYNIHFEAFLGLAFLACFAGFYLGTMGDEYFSTILTTWGVWLNVAITSVVTAIIGTIIIRILQKLSVN